MGNLTNSKDIVKLLKDVKTEKNLSLDAIVSLMEQNGHFVSKSTLSRLFSDKSEDMNFRYEDTILPLANVLLDIGSNEKEDDVDTLAFKSILRYKKDLIEDYAKQNKELKEEIETIKDREKIKYAEKIEKETKHFTDSLSFMSKQIQLKDERIDMLLSMNNELMATNNRLVSQLMDCPLRKCE